MPKSKKLLTALTVCLLAQTAIPQTVGAADNPVKRAIETIRNWLKAKRGIESAAGLFELDLKSDRETHFCYDPKQPALSFWLDEAPENNMTLTIQGSEEQKPYKKTWPLNQQTFQVPVEEIKPENKYILRLREKNGTSVVDEKQVTFHLVDTTVPNDQMVDMVKKDCMRQASIVLEEHPEIEKSQ